MLYLNNVVFRFCSSENLRKRCIVGKSCGGWTGMIIARKLEMSEEAFYHRPIGSETLKAILVLPNFWSIIIIPFNACDCAAILKLMGASCLITSVVSCDVLAASICEHTDLKQFNAHVARSFQRMLKKKINESSRALRKLTTSPPPPPLPSPFFLPLLLPSSNFLS